MDAGKLDVENYEGRPFPLRCLDRFSPVAASVVE